MELFDFDYKVWSSKWDNLWESSILLWKMGKKDVPKKKMQEWRSHFFLSFFSFFLRKKNSGKHFAGWWSVNKSQIPIEATVIKLPQTRCLYWLIGIHMTACNCCCKKLMSSMFWLWKFHRALFLKMYRHIEFYKKCLWIFLENLTFRVHSKIKSGMLLCFKIW